MLGVVSDAVNISLSRERSHPLFIGLTLRSSDMTRYCAAFSCKSRGGRGIKEERKLSFYPFPLHDTQRLEKWLRNMKRGSWVPSKHHYLCSDHFTPDSFDVRWGITYLKPNAIPTVFCATQEFKKRDYFKYKLQMKEQEPEEEISETIELNSLCKSSEPYFTKNPGTIEELNIRAETSCLRSELHLQHNEPTLKLASFASIENGMFSSSLENLLNSSTTPMECTKSDHFLESKNTANITEDSIENPISLLEVSSMDIQQTNKNSVLFNTSTKTIEQFNTKENSVITIIVPTEFSEEPSLVASSIASPQQQLVKLENAEFKESIWKDMDSGAEVLQTEHSYCRHYIYRDHLWQKIAKLHSKITVLEVQERKTLSRLKSLEALIGQLKQENLLSEEKLRIVKNCFTTF
ncbi:THAP domain-containing protein 5 isoform X3 [Rhinatrema bivittatum]|uniref:THAP domain-containing protein 5 isoform X3 n=1 Tax=Rhinatrema bivittatum TaxID=194408 RepID=UPI001129C0D4|nr:THAP domain-containing protein 5 isoform X3 [Rhinatrema bivittatum]